MKTYVDLFAGCGGLSLGVESAGFELAVAVEKSPMAARTYAHNFLFDANDPSHWSDYCNQSLSQQYRRRLVVNELASLLSDESLMLELESRSLDLVVGGPPCQGFSLAGRRNPSDSRNKLPWQYLEFVERTNPRAAVIENVVGMNQKFDGAEASSFSQLAVALQETGQGYVVQQVQVNAMHYGAPQYRPRLMLIALREDVAQTQNVSATRALWHSDFLDKIQELPDLAPRPTTTSSEVRTVRDAISDLSKGNNGTSDYPTTLNSQPWQLRVTSPATNSINHFARNHSERVTERFRLYQLLTRIGIDTKLLHPVTLQRLNEDPLFQERYFNGIGFPIEAPELERTYAGPSDLISHASELSTKKHSQRVLSWDKPARTVVTLPDDYVHPSEPRILTVREMARFQGFPDHFTFLGKETTGSLRRQFEVPQYSQVGNAVSPWLSKAVATRLNEVLYLHARTHTG